MSPRSPYRFYYAGQLAGGMGREIALSAEESHHLAHVLRLRPGAQVDVFDASGRSFSAEVVAASNREARLRMLEPIDTALPFEQPPLNLAVALLKRRAMDWLVEKLSELGVDMLQPLLAARGVVRPHAARRPRGAAHAVDDEDDDEPAELPGRWERLTIAAAKQCGRNRPLIVAPTAPLAEWLARPRPPAHTVYAHRGPGVAPIGAWIAERSGAAAERWVAIGPEGGWTPEEREAFDRAGFRPVSLGPLTLRAETAALAAAALCRLGD